MTSLDNDQKVVDLVNSVPDVYAQLLAGESINRSPTLSGDVYSGPQETLEARTAIAALTGLVFAAERAKKAKSLAQSWRNFGVGATAAMFNFERATFAYLEGFNVKPSSEGELNLHAEQVALAKGRRGGLNRMIGIAIYADAEDEDSNSDGNPTLRPCKRCIDMMQNAPEVDSRTLILGANLDFSTCELYSFGRLTRSRPSLTLEPFSLKTDADLEVYDKKILPQIVPEIYKLYGIN